MRALVRRRFDALTSLVGGFRRAAGGATMVEYGLLVAMISVGLLVSARALGTDITAVMQRISEAL